VWRDLRAAGRVLADKGAELPGARLIVLDGGASDRAPGSAFKLAPVTAIGRDLDNDLVFVDATVSGRHTVINLREGAWWVEDLGSTNGTVVNGQRLRVGTPAIARSGDVIEIGGVRLRLVTPGL
jgi:pSer/pThr/pTyr-binding forkhead associated (FHA) protein